MGRCYSLQAVASFMDHYSRVMDSPEHNQFDLVASRTRKYGCCSPNGGRLGVNLRSIGTRCEYVHQQLVVAIVNWTDLTYEISRAPQLKLRKQSGCSSGLGRIRLGWARYQDFWGAVPADTGWLQEAWLCLWGSTSSLRYALKEHKIPLHNSPNTVYFDHRRLA